MRTYDPTSLANDARVQVKNLEMREFVDTPVAEAGAHCSPAQHAIPVLACVRVHVVSPPHAEAKTRNEARNPASGTGAHGDGGIAPVN